MYGYGDAEQPLPATVDLVEVFFDALYLLLMQHMSAQLKIRSSRQNQMHAVLCGTSSCNACRAGGHCR